MEVTLKVLSDSYQLDITNNSRTLQNPAKKFSSIVNEVLEPYGAKISIDQDILVTQAIIQENETDWAFLVKTANQFGYQVYTDPSSSTLSISFGTTSKVADYNTFGSVLVSESKAPYESLLKTANQNQVAGMSHYSTSQFYSNNPFAMAGMGSNGNIVTCSHVMSQNGVLVNTADLSTVSFDNTNSEDMMETSFSSHVLS